MNRKGQRHIVKSDNPVQVINRLRERVLSSDLPTALRILCDEIDWAKQELAELKPKKGPRKFLPEVGIVLKKDVDECIKVYSEAFTKRYGVQPVKTSRLRRECQSFKNLIGDNATVVIEYYLQDDDTNAVKERHSMTDLLARAELFYEEWKSVQAI